MHLSSMLTILIVSMSLAGSLFSVSADAAIVLVSNLGEPTRAMNVLPTDGWAAQSFITDGASYSLLSVEALLGNLVGAPPIVAELHADAGDAVTPGATLTTFAVGAVPSGAPAPVTLTPTGSVTLDPLTIYWLVLGSSSPSSAGTFTWSYAEGNVTIGPGSLGNYNYSPDSGATWNNPGAENPFQIRVNVTSTPIPEPATLLLLSMGLVGLLGTRRWFAFYTQRPRKDGNR